MLPLRYLDALDADDFEGCPGLFALPHHKQEGAWRYVGSYQDAKRHKKKVFELLKRHGQREDPARWDLHHIVEGQHFADVDFTGGLARLYEEELPVVLIHKDEHIAYNQLLHIRETDELFRGDLPSDMRERAAATHRAALDPSNHGEMRARVFRLQSLYGQAYADDGVLSRIAQNVLRVQLQRL